MHAVHTYLSGRKQRVVPAFYYKGVLREFWGHATQPQKDPSRKTTRRHARFWGHATQPPKKIREDEDADRATYLGVDRLIRGGGPSLKR
jgi:hypothetical protein